jgi:hypothetical protein
MLMLRVTSVRRGFFSGSGVTLCLFGCREIHPGPTCFRKTDRHRLLGRTRTALAIVQMLYLFSYEFAGLRRGSFAFALIALNALKDFFLRHDGTLRKGNDEPTASKWHAMLAQRLSFFIHETIEGEFQTSLLNDDKETSNA